MGLYADKGVGQGGFEPPDLLRLSAPQGLYP